DNDSFEQGVLAAVNLGDDTDTTAAIYGQLAGAYYGYKNLPKNWVEQVYAKKFILNLSKWIAYEGENWKKMEISLSSSQFTNDIDNSVPVYHQERIENKVNVLLVQRNSGCKTVPNERQANRRSILELESMFSEVDLLAL
ncbi:unnamed protein product, partial [Rotaria sp. Silwood1]